MQLKETQMLLDSARQDIDRLNKDAAEAKVDALMAKADAAAVVAESAQYETVSRLRAIIEERDATIVRLREELRAAAAAESDDMIDNETPTGVFARKYPYLALDPVRSCLMSSAYRAHGFICRWIQQPIMSETSFINELTSDLEAINVEIIGTTLRGVYVPGLRKKN